MEKDMKILITSDWNINAVNGVVTSMENLKEELEKRGHEVKFLTLSSSFKNEQYGDTYAVGSISAEWIYHMARIRFRRGQKILRELIEWKPDVIHSQCEFSSFFLARHIAAKCRVPLVHTCHTVYEDYVGYVLPFFRSFGVHTVRQIFQYCSRRSDRFIAPTEKVRALLESYPVYCPVSVIPTGIKLKSFDKTVTDEEKKKIREKTGIGERRMLLFLGRLGKEKNVSELLAYMSHIERDDISFVIVGDGPYRTELEKEAAELGLTSPKVVFAGMVSPEDVHLWYGSADLFINASLSETQGLTYIEALASSLPLLVRKDPCLDGVVDNGSDGWEYETEEEFREYLTEYLEKEDNSEMRERAKAKAYSYSSTVFADRIEKLYTEEIEGKKNA